MVSKEDVFLSIVGVTIGCLVVMFLIGQYQQIYGYNNDCSPSKKKIQQEYGIVEDFEIVGTKPYSCTITFEGSGKAVYEGLICKSVRIGSQLVRYDFDYCRGWYPYGSVERIE